MCGMPLIVQGSKISFKGCTTFRTGKAILCKHLYYAYGDHEVKKKATIVASVSTQRGSILGWGEGENI